MSSVHGGKLVANSLKREGIEYIFTLSGGHINPIYEACAEAGIKVIDTRHEQAAAHMAEAWGKLTGKPGICVVTAGPGLTDAFTGIANAKMANSPMIIISGRSGVSEADTLALQEMEQMDFVRPMVKWGRTVYETRRIEEYMAMAFRHAMTGRPGPVYLEIPIDIIMNKVNERDIVKPEGYRPQYKPAGSPEAIVKAIQMLLDAKKPAIIAGSGAFYSECGPELIEFIEMTGVPVFTSQLGRGVLPDDHPNCMSRLIAGGIGALINCDLVLLMGARLSLFLLNGKPPAIPYNARVIQIDIEGTEIGRNRAIDLGIVGDLKEVLKGMINQAKGKNWNHSPWCRTMKDQTRAITAGMLDKITKKTDPIHPAMLMTSINEFLDRDAVVVGDGGDTQIWINMIKDVYKPGHYLETGVFGCLGVGIPFALSAKLRYPEKQVLVVMGDGSAGLNIMEFHTAIRFNLPIVMVVNNDCSWGMIRHIQNVQCEMDNRCGCELGKVAYDKIIQSLGGYGETVEKAEDIIPALKRAFASGLPACINVYTDRGAISPFTMMLYNIGKG